MTIENADGLNTSDREALPGYPGFWCSGLDDTLTEALIARTLDTKDVRLREMTRDLARFSSRGQMDRWRPGRDLLCLQDRGGALLGIVWIADKPLPERDDYREVERLRAHDLNLTCAIRTYGPARGRGLLTKTFADHALEELLRKRGGRQTIWYQTKAANKEARALGWQMGFLEVTGEADGTVIGVRFED